MTADVGQPVPQADTPSGKVKEVLVWAALSQFGLVLGERFATIGAPAVQGLRAIEDHHNALAEGLAPARSERSDGLAPRKAHP